MADASFDMFSAGEPFSAKLLRAASSFDAEPAVVYAALIVGISIEATVIAEVLSFDCDSIGSAAMADGMKFVISSLPEATVEELAEIIEAVVEATDGDHAVLLTDPMSVVSKALTAEESDDEVGDEEFADADSGGEDEEIEYEESDEEIEDADEESDDEIDHAEFRDTVKAKIAGWDDWVPDDEVLRALKISFAETCVAALSTPAPEDF